MRLLYIFPHPDDESFGPAGAIRQQVLDGHEVYLLTLTKGGATRVRHALGLSVEEMGLVREKELEDVAEVLGLTELIIKDLPDSGFKEMDPRLIEKVVEECIERIRPQVLVTYPVHGVSGFHDHLVCHAVVKRVYLEMKDHGATYLQRLAFLAVTESMLEEVAGSMFNLSTTPLERVGCVVEVSEEAHAAFHAALDCYLTYRETIKRSKIRKLVTRNVPFELFQESHVPPLADLTDGLMSG